METIIRTSSLNGGGLARADERMVPGRLEKQSAGNHDLESDKSAREADDREPAS